MFLRHLKLKRGQFKGQIRSSDPVRGAAGFVCFDTHTHTYEFLWSTAAISASAQTKPESGNHQMPPTLHVLSYEKMHTRARAAHKRSTCSHAKQAPRSLYLPTDADDQAADECRQTGDERVHVAAETIAGLRLGRSVEG